MSIRKYTDWYNYWLPLRQNIIKCIGTTGTAWLGSNGLSQTGIPGTSGIGLDWRQACGLFAIHIAFEVFSYMQKVQPEIIEKNEDTVQITKP